MDGVRLKRRIVLCALFPRFDRWCFPFDRWGSLLVCDDLIWYRNRSLWFFLELCLWLVLGIDWNPSLQFARYRILAGAVLFEFPGVFDNVLAFILFCFVFELLDFHCLLFQGRTLLDFELPWFKCCWLYYRFFSPFLSDSLLVYTNTYFHCSRKWILLH